MLFVLVNVFLFYKLSKARCWFKCAAISHVANYGIKVRLSVNYVSRNQHRNVTPLVFGAPYLLVLERVKYG